MLFLSLDHARFFERSVELVRPPSSTPVAAQQGLSRWIPTGILQYLNFWMTPIEFDDILIQMDI